MTVKNSLMKGILFIEVWPKLKGILKKRLKLSETSRRKLISPLALKAQGKQFIGATGDETPIWLYSQWWNTQPQSQTQHPKRKEARKEHFDFSPLQSSHCLHELNQKPAAVGPGKVPNVLLAKQLIRGNQPGSLFRSAILRMLPKMNCLLEPFQPEFCPSHLKEITLIYVVFNTKLQILLPHRAKLVSLQVLYLLKAISLMAPKTK